MKRSVKQSLLFILLLIGAVQVNYAQEAKPQQPSHRDSMPYIKYPEMPAFNIMLSDSVTVINTFNIPKGRPTMIVFFDPDCKHCKAETKELMEGIDSLSNIDIYFVTPVHDMWRLRDFAKEYHLTGHPNIKAVGRDYEFFFASYYDVKFVPDVVLYDEHKNYLRLFEGHATIKELYDYTHKAK